MVYPITDTVARANIFAVEKWRHSFETPQSIVHEQGTAFIITDFTLWTKKLGNTPQCQTTYSPWINGKMEAQNQQNLRKFSNNVGNNWSSFEPIIAFARNTAVNYTTKETL